MKYVSCTAVHDNIGLGHMHLQEQETEEKLYSDKIVLLLMKITKKWLMLKC